MANENNNIIIINPELNKTSFQCPNCSVLSQQDWHNVFYEPGNSYIISGLKIAFCKNSECMSYSLWRDYLMVFPKKVTALIAHVDMPDDVKEIYNEAREVCDISPRAAAALLRVSLEKLTDHLGESTGKLNTRIGNLSKQGLPQKVIQSLDIVRINANEGGSHAGEIDLTGEDNIKIVHKLFWLVNFIVEKVISDVKVIDEMFDELPENKKDGISQRDAE